MTIEDVLDEVTALKTHQYTDAQVVKWLHRLDVKILNDIINQHYHFDENGDLEGDVDTPDAYSAEAEEVDTELLVEDPYSELYIPYVYAMIDFNNGEFSRYNNSMVMFNSMLQDYANWYNRSYMPKQTNYINPFGKFAIITDPDDPLA